MSRKAAPYVNRKKAERELFNARQTLIHLVEIYENGKWRRLYKADVFAEIVRNARVAVDHWSDIVGQLGKRA